MRSIAIITYLAFFVLGPTLAQDILIDFVNGPSEIDSWAPLIDTLEFYGATVHYVENESWVNLLEMDGVWIVCLNTYYDDATKSALQDFSRNGGRIIVYSTDGHWWTNDLIMDSEWRTTMELLDTMPIGPVSPETSRCIIPLPPLTDGVNSLLFSGWPYIVHCGEHAFPFVFIDSSCSQSCAAISYPFLHEDNCSSFIVLVLGAYGLHWGGCNPDLHFWLDAGRFNSNLLLCAAGVPGYELEPGAIPGGGNACAEIPEEYHCTRAPNPFTPNSDGINDYVQFEYPELFYRTADIFIYNIHNHEVKQINVPEGANAKTAARWLGDDNNGNPLPQGLYIYVIESGGEIVCEGTVVIAR